MYKFDSHSDNLLFCFHQQSSCPCEGDLVCKKKDESEYWGKCTAEESGSGGSGDF